VSDSRHIDAPMFLRRALKDLALAARKLDLTEAGSRRRAKAPVRVQRLHGRVAARRATWQQHLAIALTEYAHLVGVETLSLKGMARRKKGYRFGRSIGDNGYGLFVQVREQYLGNADTSERIGPLLKGGGCVDSGFGAEMKGQD
jgi:putative transposase